MSGPDIQQAAERTHVSPARIVISALLGIAVVVAVIWFIDQNAATYEEAMTELTTISPVWIGLLVATAILNIVVYPFTVLVAIPQLSYWQGFVERQTGFLVSNAIPGGGAIAVGTQYAILNRYRVPPGLAAAAVSADAVWTYLLTLGMPSLGVGLLVLEGRTNGHLTGIAVIGLVAFLVSLVAVVLIIRSPESAHKVGTAGQWLADRLFRLIKRNPPDVVSAAVDFHGSAHDLVSRKWVALTVTNVAAQATPFLVLLAALAGIGAFPEQVTLIEIFAAYSAAILLTSFPLTPGGLGTVDLALIGLLVAFGATPGQAAAADVIWRLFWFLPQLVVGLVAFLINLVAERRHPTG